MRIVRALPLAVATMGMLCLGTGRLRAEGVASPLPEAEITRKLEDLQGQIDFLRAQLAEAKKASAASAAPTESIPAAAASPGEETAPAAPPAEETKTTLQSILGATTVSGFVDGYYGLDFNHPHTRTTAFRVFDVPTNQFSLNYAKLQLDKSADASSRLGYRISFGYGNGINVVNSFEPGGLGFTQYMQEAFGTYLAPVGKNGLQIDAGKFVTPHGGEVIESKDNWNYTRGILFGFAIPFYHFGVRTKYAWNSKVALTGFVVNGWNNVVDNNSGKTYGVTLNLNPHEKVAIAQNYMAGPEMTDINMHWRQLSDTVVTINATDKLSFMINYDYGTGDDVGLSESAWWTGVAGYLRYAVDDRHAFALRYEWFKDPMGFSTGTSQQLKEFTATFEKRIAGNLITRLEYRHDYSTEPTFVKGDVPVKSQNTLTGALMYVFSSAD